MQIRSDVQMQFIKFDKLILYGTHESAVKTLLSQPRTSVGSHSNAFERAQDSYLALFTLLEPSLLVV
jgi:hypothetical protein